MFNPMQAWPSIADPILNAPCETQLCGLEIVAFDAELLFKN